MIHIDPIFWKVSCYRINVQFNACMFLTGWYERLVTFMDFEDAVVAMIDEDQKDAANDFFDKATDLFDSIGKSRWEIWVGRFSL